MISYLSIQNYTLIDKLEIRFSNNMNIITGETGAGKSILLGALSLVLGQRADTSTLLNKEKKCIIEGHFNIRTYDLSDFFEKNELDYEDLTILRREITPNNRSRAFINDTPVNNNLLKEFASRLIDIHSQHNSLSLMNSDYQMEVLDDFADNIKVIEDYKSIFKTYKSECQKLTDLIAEDNAAKADADYFNFLLNELQAAALYNGEQEEIENELLLLNNAEEIKRKLNNAITLFSEAPCNLLSALKEIVSDLGAVNKFMPATDDLLQRLESSYIELKDIVREIELIEDKVAFSPERAAQITERINLIYSLQSKHRVKCISELLHIASNLEEKLQNIDNMELTLAKLKEKTKKDFDELLNIAKKIREKRIKVKPLIEEKITTLLKELNMPEAVFQINLIPLDDLNNYGLDKVVFKFSANKGIAAEDMSKVASGGELSRLMLAIKSVVSQNKLLPALIFDEIDTGISGEAAVKTGFMLQKMSENMQIIAITHLPQIARLGTTHFEVYKTNADGATQTHIRKLSNDERIKVIATMISGSDLAASAVDAAKDLLALKN